MLSCLGLVLAYILPTYMPKPIGKHTKPTGKNPKHCLMTYAQHMAKHDRVKGDGCTVGNMIRDGYVWVFMGAMG